MCKYKKTSKQDEYRKWEEASKLYHLRQRKSQEGRKGCMKQCHTRIRSIQGKSGAEQKGFIDDR